MMLDEGMLKNNNWPARKDKHLWNQANDTHGIMVPAEKTEGKTKGTT